jgi:hypothetical protein
METLPKLMLPDASPSEPCSTDASHSSIGRSTAIDYNLASMHKNAILIVGRTVIVSRSIGRLSAPSKV